MIKIKTCLKQENKVVSVDGVNGSELVLGSMTEVSTSGNWPTIFDAKKKKNNSSDTIEIHQFKSNFFIGDENGFKLLK